MHSSIHCMAGHRAGAGGWLQASLARALTRGTQRLTGSLPSTLRKGAERHPESADGPPPPESWPWQLKRPECPCEAAIRRRQEGAHKSRVLTCTASGRQARRHAIRKAAGSEMGGACTGAAWVVGRTRIRRNEDRQSGGRQRNAAAARPSHRCQPARRCASCRSYGRGRASALPSCRVRVYVCVRGCAFSAGQGGALPPPRRVCMRG